MLSQGKALIIIGKVSVCILEPFLTHWFCRENAKAVELPRHCNWTGLSLGSVECQASIFMKSKNLTVGELKANHLQ
jgi:hypothetical protein